MSESRSYHPVIFKGQPDSQMSQQFRINLVSHVTPLGKQVVGKFLLQDISLYPRARNRHPPSTFATTVTFGLLYSTMPRCQLTLSFLKVPMLWQSLHSSIENSTHCVLSLDPKILCLDTFFWYATTHWLPPDVLIVCICPCTEQNVSHWMHCISITETTNFLDLAASVHSFIC